MKCIKNKTFQSYAAECACPVMAGETVMRLIQDGWRDVEARLCENTGRVKIWGSR